MKRYCYTKESIWYILYVFVISIFILLHQNCTRISLMLKKTGRSKIYDYIRFFNSF